ncbi:hypothetical protein [Tranquillimonas alkanivorans]|uniref:hypothetical protein n=1 Tax=Tranquillimonas alkanivorans TaxID=441119 RepID=UPI0011604E6B|nr:hypothetical protein [Tranquillimonas alkanivorans]
MNRHSASDKRAADATFHRKGFRSHGSAWPAQLSSMEAAETSVPEDLSCFFDERGDVGPAAFPLVARRDDDLHRHGTQGFGWPVQDRPLEFHCDSNGLIESRGGVAAVFHLVQRRYLLAPLSEKPFQIMILLIFDLEASSIAVRPKVIREQYTRSWPAAA